MHHSLTHTDVGNDVLSNCFDNISRNVGDRSGDVTVAVRSLDWVDADPFNSKDVDEVCVGCCKDCATVCLHLRILLSGTCIGSDFDGLSRTSLLCGSECA